MKQGIRVRLFDINKFDITKEIEIDIQSEISRQLLEHSKELKEMGIDFEISCLKIQNPTLFYYWILNTCFPIYDIIDCQSKNLTEKNCKGHPDFRLTLKKEFTGRELSWELSHLNCSQEIIESLKTNGQLPIEIYIEIKKNGDGLNYNQFEWMMNNKKDKKIYILFIKEDKTGY